MATAHAEKSAAITNTRQAFRLAILEGLRLEVDGLLVPIEGGPLDGIEVVSKGVLNEAIERLKYGKLPRIDDTSAEVKTPAEVYVDAVCPRCRLAGRILANITSELLVTTTHSELRLKAKAKPHTHICGQLSLDDAPTNGQADFGLEDIVGSGDELTDEERAQRVEVLDDLAAAGQKLVDAGLENDPEVLASIDAESVSEAEVRHERLLHAMPDPEPLACKGNVHVPGHSEGCPKYVTKLCNELVDGDPCGLAQGHEGDHDASLLPF